MRIYCTSDNREPGQPDRFVCHTVTKLRPCASVVVVCPNILSVTVGRLQQRNLRRVVESNICVSLDNICRYEPTNGAAY